MAFCSEIDHADSKLRSFIFIDIALLGRSFPVFVKVVSSLTCPLIVAGYADDASKQVSIASRNTTDAHFPMVAPFFDPLFSEFYRLWKKRH